MSCPEFYSKILTICCFQLRELVSWLQPGHYSNLTAPNLQHTTNQERNDQCGNQHRSRELLMMGIVVPETCWAYKKYIKNKKWHLVGFYSSVITTMHGSTSIKLYRRYFDGLVFRIVSFKWSDEMLFFCTDILCMLMIGWGRVTVWCQTLSMVIALATR